MGEAALVSCEKRTNRLTQIEIGLLLQLAKDGLTQAQIAQRLGITQQAVSKWLNATTDTTETARLYLRGSALRMARNVVQKGQARDHIQALKGIGVLEQDRSDINIAVGVSLPGLPTVSVPATATVTVSPLPVVDKP